MPGPEPFEFASAAEKRAFVRDLFARLAARYETVNLVMSMGRVGAWRRAAAAATVVPPGGWVMDVAAGVGGLSRALALRWPTAGVVGVDFASEMIEAGRAADTERRTLLGDQMRPSVAVQVVGHPVLLESSVWARSPLPGQGIGDYHRGGHQRTWRNW